MIVPAPTATQLVVEVHETLVKEFPLLCGVTGGGGAGDAVSAHDEPFQISANGE
jgi:hypothetical protein